MTLKNNPAAGAVASFDHGAGMLSGIPKIAVLTILMCFGAYTADTAGNDTTAADSLPPLEVLPSEFVSVLEYSFTQAGPAVVFEGSFTISGEGIYGHFDLVLFDDSGAQIKTCSSSDRAYRRDRGSKVKPVSISCVVPDTCVKVQLYFHEMRLHPDDGPCMQNGSNSTQGQ